MSWFEHSCVGAMKEDCKVPSTQFVDREQWDIDFIEKVCFSGNYWWLRCIELISCNGYHDGVICSFSHDGLLGMIVRLIIDASAVGLEAVDCGCRIKS